VQDSQFLVAGLAHFSTGQFEAETQSERSGRAKGFVESIDWQFSHCFPDLTMFPFPHSSLVETQEE